MSDDKINVLLVEDDVADAALTREALSRAKIVVNLTVMQDGEEALNFLKKRGPYATAPSPDLILLDLNMPKKDGREVLKEIKADPKLSSIPVIVLTTSDADMDIVKSYNLGANCYVTKPVGFEAFTQVVRQIESFWFTIVKLPPRHS